MGFATKHSLGRRLATESGDLVVDRFEPIRQHLPVEFALGQPASRDAHLTSQRLRTEQIAKPCGQRAGIIFSHQGLGTFIADSERQGLSATLADRLMWGKMRMSPTDIMDVTGSTYTFLINGQPLRLPVEPVLRLIGGASCRERV